MVSTQPVWVILSGLLLVLYEKGLQKHLFCYSCCPKFIQGTERGTRLPVGRAELAQGSICRVTSIPRQTCQSPKSAFK